MHTTTQTSPCHVDERDGTAMRDTHPHHRRSHNKRKESSVNSPLYGPQNSDPNNTFVCTTLHLHYTTIHYTTLHYRTLQYTTLHYTTLHYTTLHKPAAAATARAGPTQSMPGTFTTHIKPSLFASTQPPHERRHSHSYCTYPILQGDQGAHGNTVSTGHGTTHDKPANTL